MAKKILIVEDDPLITKIYSTRLISDGYEVKNAENGEIALQIVGEYNPDLVMLDVMMPKVDGFECLKGIRAMSQFATIPILMYSNLGAEEEQLRAKEYGVTEFFVKANISPTQLVSNIKKYLGDDITKTSPPPAPDASVEKNSDSLNGANVSEGSEDQPNKPES